MKKALSACVAVTSVTLLDSPGDQIAALEQAFAVSTPSSHATMTSPRPTQTARASRSATVATTSTVETSRPQASTNPRSTEGRKAQAEDYPTLNFCKSLSLLAGSWLLKLVELHTV